MEVTVIIWNNDSSQFSSFPPAEVRQHGCNTILSHCHSHFFNSVSISFRKCHKRASPVVAEAADGMSSIVVFLVLLFLFLLNCDLVVCLVLYFSCYSGVKLPVGYLCCHFWRASCFLFEVLFVLLLWLFMLPPRVSFHCGSSLVLSLSNDCPSQCIESSRCPSLWSDYRIHKILQLLIM